MFVRSLVLGVSAVALMVGGAQAADLIIPTTPQPIMASAPGFDWEGLYVGARVGASFFDVEGLDGDEDDTITFGVVGAAVGVNFIPADPFLVGVEATADYLWNTEDGADINYGEFFANVRAGVVITDSALVYALGGVGVAVYDEEDLVEGADNTEALYQLGAGVEFAVTDAITVRGEVVGQGSFDDEEGDDEFFNNAKATVGVFYHF